VWGVFEVYRANSASGSSRTGTPVHWAGSTKYWSAAARSSGGQTHPRRAGSRGRPFASWTGRVGQISACRVLFVAILGDPRGAPHPW